LARKKTIGRSKFLGFEVPTPAGHLNCEIP
jgi:hypothetical protein